MPESPDDLQRPARRQPSRDRVLPTDRPQVCAGLAAAIGVTLTALHVAWSLGVRWGWSACGWGDLTAVEARTGCHAADVGDIGLTDGWLAAAGWLLVTLTAARLATGRTGHPGHPGRFRQARGRLPAYAAAGGLLVVSFPLHLLFEIPVGLAGAPTDWRHVATRLAATTTAVLLVVAVRRPPCRHDVVDAPLSRGTRRAVWAAAAVPCVFWAGPHLAWMSGVALGVSEDLLRDGRSLPLAAQVAVTFAPVVGAALTLALLTPIARRWPRAVPLVGGRHVPPALPTALAGGVGLLLLAYGVIGVAMMSRDLVVGAATWAELATGWAAVMTELAFVAWGGALLAAAIGLARAGRCPACASEAAGPSHCTNSYA